MASAHLVLADQGIQGQRQPQVPAEYFGSQIGRQAEEAAGVFMKIDNAANDAQASAIHVAGEKGLDDALITTAQNSPTADDFNKNISAALKTAYDDALAPASNNKVKSIASSKLALSYANHQTKAKEVYWKKKIGETKQNDLFVEEDMKNKAIEGDAAITNEYFNQYRGMMMNRAQQGVYEPDEAAKRILAFSHDVIGTKMALGAKADPLNFFDRVKRGDFGTGATALQIQTSMNIADSEIKQRETRDAQIGRQKSEEAERLLEKQAAERKMDINELYRQAHIYGWDDKKVNGLINMQIGLNLANPYEEKLIEDAAVSIYRSIRPTMGEITEANQKIENLVKEKLISNQTTAYKSMKTRLQRMAEVWRVDTTMTGIREVNQNTKTESDARRDVFDAYKKHYPAQIPDRVSRERSNELEALEGLDAAGRRQRVKELRERLDKQFEARKNPAVRAGELRGTMKGTGN